MCSIGSSYESRPYIRKFIEDHKAEIDKRSEELAAGTAKDAFLLILSPSRAVGFYRTNDAHKELFKLIEPYRQERREFSEDYYRVLNYYSLDKYPANNFTFRKVLHYEGVEQRKLKSLLEVCLAKGVPFCSVDDEIVKGVLAKAKAVRGIMDSDMRIADKADALAGQILVENAILLRQELEKAAIDDERAAAIEHQEEEQAELEEIEIKQMSAVELMTIVGSKGLSADHVIITGVDNVNMAHVTENAFFVAMTRARRSLHIMTALKAGEPPILTST